MKRRICSGTVAIFLALVSSSIHAQSTGLNGFDLRLYRPPTSGSGIFNLHRSETLSSGSLATTLDLDLGSGLLSAQNATTAQTIRVVDNQSSFLFSLAAGLPKRFEAGFQVPYVFWQDGQNFLDQSDYSTGSLGDLLVDLKWNPVPIASKHPGLALSNRVTFPTGNRQKFTGFGEVTYEARLITDYQVKNLTMAMNVGYQFVPETSIPGATMDDRLTFGAGADFVLPVWQRTLHVMGEIDGYTVPSGAGEITTPVQWLAGLKKDFRETLALSVGGGKGIIGGMGEGEWRAVANLSYQFSLKRKGEKAELIQTIYFPYDKSRYHPRHEAVVDRAAEQWQQKKRRSLELHGHSDDTGDESYNLKLASERAETVKETLVDKHVPPEKMAVKSFGEERPAVEQRSREARGKNRRVEIYLIR